ncbi:hypothetical protein B0H15DRAFT_947843 [Mycena belliarum]|uniref:Uncharacterized protein n=1 Tax=Mycena belliarum TaxID=1033014 RepID=A0AAD6XTS5_9AGAR|nr:hypothetical protein B0H15DRAFT_947843 [Mycena belliae]
MSTLPPALRFLVLSSTVPAARACKEYVTHLPALVSQRLIDSPAPPVGAIGLGCPLAAALLGWSFGRRHAAYYGAPAAV